MVFVKRFRVPSGLTAAGRLVSAAEAIRTEAYTCPVCDSRLSLHAGPIVRRHFAHLPAAVCAPETVVHHTAKYLIAQAVSDWRSGTIPAPTIGRPCSRCRQGYVYQALPDRITHARVEFRLAEGLVADVALLSGEQVEAIVEICVTHAVDTDKAMRLDRLPWIELHGPSVVLDPLHWHPMATGNLRPARDRMCEECTAIEKRLEQRVEQVARNWHIELPGKPYKVIVHDCYRCGSDILLFDWGGMWDARKPPYPVPWTVKPTFSQTIGRSYWMNTCPKCKAKQGDHFIKYLFGDPDNVLDLRNRPIPRPSEGPRQLSIPLRAR